MKIVIIGSGNVATHLSLALKAKGENIIQVYSKTITHAEELAAKLSCDVASHIANIRTDADAYIFSVKDDAVFALLREIVKCANEEAVFIHTAGSIPLPVLDGMSRHCGVLYPMQTFSKMRNVDFAHIPCFIEASDEKAMRVVRSLAASISESVHEVSSEKRKKLHLAAVFACNLTNHCYRLAEKVLQEDGLDFSLFLPLINETAKKVNEMSPRDAQTGPMVRYDQGVMNMQMSLISDERTREIYRLMADSIHEDARLK